MTNYLSPELVRMIGWALLHFVWQGAVVAAVLSLALAFCRRASVRYALGVGSLLVMLALPVATVLVLRQPSEDAVEVSDASDGMSPAAANLATLGPLPGHTHSAKGVETVPAQSETMLWLVRIWMLGVIAFSLRSAGGFVLMQRLRRMATVPVSAELLALCRAMQEKMGIERAVRFCRSAALQVPAVVGGIRPIVLLPITALTGLSDAQIEAIVAHELAHIRRLDYFVNLFQVFAETVLFYHPAVWWVNKRIRIERENCCDDTAIAVCGDRLAYVRALTHLESLRITPQFAMAANGSPLKARVRRLLGMAEESEGVRSGSSVLGVMVVAGVILAASSVVSGAKVQADQQQEPPAPVVAPAPAPSLEATPAMPSHVPEEPVNPQVAPAPSPAPAPAPEPAEAPNVEVNVPPIHLQAHEVNVPPVHVQVPAVNVPPVHVHVPEMNVAVPAVNVHVPPVNVNIPAIHMQAMNFSVPAIHVNVPQMDIKVPAIHIPAMMGQASGGTQPSESYIDGMKAAGYGDLTVDELVAMKIQGITPEYVRGFKEQGVKVDPDDLIALKVQGVTPEYVKQMRAAYPGIDVDEIIGFKVQGVNPEYVAEFTKLGVKADPDELMGLKVQGVTAQYVRDMRATGMNFDTDELIGMKVQGVTPAYVNALKAAGMKDLGADEIIGAKSQGITPEFVEKARSHGFKDLDLDKLIELKVSGVL